MGGARIPRQTGIGRRPAEPVGGRVVDLGGCFGRQGALNAILIRN